MTELSVNFGPLTAAQARLLISCLGRVTLGGSHIDMAQVLVERLQNVIHRCEE